MDNLSHVKVSASSYRCKCNNYDTFAVNGSCVVYACGTGVLEVDISMPSSMKTPPVFYTYSRKSEVAQIQSSSKSLPWERPSGAPLIIGLESTTDTTKALNKVNQVISVALSKEHLAYGETGYLPRVILFERNPGKVLAVMHTHLFGVHKIAFSPDGRYMATLGLPNDGYLHIWDVKGQFAAPFASNRCISEVHDMQWISNNQLVTAGLRHLRIWTLPENSNGSCPHVLSGRNVVLGQSANANCLTILNDGKRIIVACKDGKFLSIEIELSASIVADCESGIRNATLHNGVLYGLGDDIIQLDNGQKTVITAQCKPERLFVVDGHLFCIENSQICTLDLKNGWTSQPITGECMEGGSPRENGMLLWNNNDILRCDQDWEVLQRDTYPFHIHRAVDYHGSLIVTSSDGIISFDNKEVQVHNGSITSLDISENMIVTGSVDRHLQVWTRASKDDAWVMRTMALLGPVRAANIVDDSSILVSTPNLTQLHFLQGKDWTCTKLAVKGSPLSQCIVEDTLLVATGDKLVFLFDFDGTSRGSFRTLDTVGDPVSLTQMTACELEGEKYILCITSDKAVSLYSFPQGRLVGSIWTHSESVSHLVWLPLQKQAVTFSNTNSFLYTFEVKRYSLSVPQSPNRSPRQSFSGPRSPLRCLVRPVSPTKSRSSPTGTKREVSPLSFSKPPSPNSKKPLDTKSTQKIDVVGQLEMSLSAFNSSEAVGTPKLEKLLSDALEKVNPKYKASSRQFGQEIVDFVRQQLENDSKDH